MEQRDLDLEHVLGILRRRAPLVMICVVVLAAAGFCYSKQQTKMYTGSASVTFKNDSLTEQIVGLNPVDAENSFAQQEENLRLIETGDAAKRTAMQIGNGLTPEDVSNSLTISPEGEFSGIRIAAESSSPTLAATIANTYSKEFVKAQHHANREFFDSALAHVKKQLANMSPAQRSASDGVDVSQRAHTLELLAELGYNDAQVLQKAAPPSGPSSPKTKRNTAVSGFLGLILGLTLAFLLERFDRRVRDPKSLESIYGLPILGVVPKLSSLSKSGLGRKRKGNALSPPEVEAFSLIRAHLRFFNVDREVRTIVVASPGAGDGKTTVARYLAEAAARSGAHTLLLEADLRHPTLAQQLDVRPGPGLADVLIGAALLNEAIHSVDLHVPSDEGVREHALDVLVAGAAPPNPGELLESQAMDAVLVRAKYTYDFVVIDTSPLMTVSDAFPLLAKADGVVLVGRVGHSRRDAADRLHQDLATSGAHLLGVIANGSKSVASDSYFMSSKSSPTAAPADGDSPSEVLSPNTKS